MYEYADNYGVRGISITKYAYFAEGGDWVCFVYLVLRSLGIQLLHLCLCSAIVCFNPASAVISSIMFNCTVSRSDFGNRGRHVTTGKTSSINYLFENRLCVSLKAALFTYIWFCFLHALCQVPL